MKIKNITNRMLAGFIVWGLLCWCELTFAQGSLTPPGTPGASMKTLSQIEPRIPVSSLPFVINHSGSYYITTNLTGIAGSDGITINADDVTLDLGGWTLAGISGSVNGISSTHDRITVQNGTVRDWGGIGIYLYSATDVRIEDVIVANNASFGIQTGQRSQIKDCAAVENENAGFEVNNDSIIFNCQSYSNSVDGITAHNACRVRDCICRGNGDDGISVQEDSQVVGCISVGNHYGVYLSGARSTVRNSKCNGNAQGGVLASISDAVVSKCEIIGNGTYGISIGNDGTVENNSISKNKNDGIIAQSRVIVCNNFIVDNGNGGIGVGINVSGDNGRIEHNLVTGADTGIKITGSDNYLADNTVRENTDNYNFTSGNHLNLLLCEVPESLNWPCSVKFAGDLICTRTNVNGITVSANNVTIDMAGHTLTGPGANSKSGIYQDGYRNLTVKNGKIVLWRISTYGMYSGIEALGTENIISDVQVSTNYNGMYLGNDCLVKNCTAYNNRHDGIHAGWNNSVHDCVASYNGQYGISCMYGSLLTGSVAQHNKATGFNSGSYSTVINCSASINDGGGFFVGNGSMIKNCTADYNQSSGIGISEKGQVVGCNCTGNSDSGISSVSGGGCRIDSNNLIGNAKGIYLASGGNLVVRNSASGNTTNYDIATGNNVGTIQTTPAGAGAWDNFSF